MGILKIFLALGEAFYLFYLLSSDLKHLFTVLFSHAQGDLHLLFVDSEVLLSNFITLLQEHKLFLFSYHIGFQALERI